MPSGSSAVTKRRWLRAHGGWLLDTDRAAGRRLFHAYTDEGNAACEPMCGLGAGDEPNEGDLADLCPPCMDVVRRGE